MPAASAPVESSGDELLTTEEIAKRLKFKARRVRDYVASGRIPAIRLNPRDLRFHWPTVIKHLHGLEPK